MIDALLRVLSRCLFMMNIDASQIQTDDNQVQRLWKSLLQQVQANQAINTQPIKDLLQQQCLSIPSLNDDLTAAMYSLPKQLSNLFFSAQKCSCGQLIKKFSFISYNNSVSGFNCSLCKNCHATTLPIQKPTLIAVIGNEKLSQIKCKIDQFGEQYILLNAFRVVGSQFTSLLVNEASTNKTDICRSGSLFQETEISLELAQKELLGSLLIGPMNCAFYIKLSSIQLQLQQRLLTICMQIDGPSMQSTPQMKETTNLLLNSPIQSNQSQQLQTATLMTSEQLNTTQQQRLATGVQNIVRVNGFTMPLWILISLVFLVFFALFCFFGDIAIFVEIKKAKDRVTKLENPK